jgi:hypothetical protein
MKISGFSMARNASKLYYPVKEAVMSALPLVDEFVIAIGKGDEDDITRQLIESIGDSKIKIIDTEWDIQKYSRGTENAHQTDIAKEHCTGDWLLYLQADELIHEEDYDTIRKTCEKYVDNSEVEGFILRYRHFWGDYNHYHTAHGWYPHEIRIVRNHPDIHSWESAQSFRRIPDFDGLDYRVQKGTFMLKVVLMDAWIYHYGWVRPPQLMKSKNKALATIHKGEKKVRELEKNNFFSFDYGPLNKLKNFYGSHPIVMAERISEFSWGKELQYSGKVSRYRKKHKHETLKNKIFTFIKVYVPGMKRSGDFKNFILLDKKKYPENKAFY